MGEVVEGKKRKVKGVRVNHTGTNIFSLWKRPKERRADLGMQLEGRETGLVPVFKVLPGRWPRPCLETRAKCEKDVWESGERKCRG